MVVEPKKLRYNLIVSRKHFNILFVAIIGYKLNYMELNILYPTYLEDENVYLTFWTPNELIKLK